MKAILSTPYGDFDFVKTDLSIGPSCFQCCLHDSGPCHLIDCERYDSELGDYHLTPHVEVVPESVSSNKKYSSNYKY